MATTQAHLVCPYCEAQNTYIITEDAVSGGHFRAQCFDCTRPFTTQLIKVRAKSGRQDKKTNTREVSIRGSQLLTDQDTMIKFVKVGVDDIEARSGDIITLQHYVDAKGNVGQPGIAQNKSVNQYWRLKPPPGPGCGQAAALPWALEDKRARTASALGWGGAVLGGVVLCSYFWVGVSIGVIGLGLVGWALRAEKKYQAAKVEARRAELVAASEPDTDEVGETQPEALPDESAETSESGGESDVATEIRRLAELRDEGLLSDEEFEAKKKQLLGL